ncbi:hypothetical protein LZ31DRAFT_550375 [Colletotrichum somersetense]|nr:hypothetical protein LZ31DRAFT_550375 [Colletotrichum somersetense]
MYTAVVTLALAVADFVAELATKKGHYLAAAFVNLSIDFCIGYVAVCVQALDL